MLSVISVICLCPWVQGKHLFSAISKPSVHYIYPQENQTVYYKDITLRWDLLKKDQNTILQISESADFQKIIIEKVVHESFFSVPTLAKGTEYYWRIVTPDNKTQSTYSFFKTTTIKIDFLTSCSLQLIPSIIDDLPLLYIDNPEFKLYNITIHDLKSMNRILERNSDAEYQCVPVYKFPKGRFLIKIKVPQQESENISEITMTIDE